MAKRTKSGKRAPATPAGDGAWIFSPPGLDWLAAAALVVGVVLAYLPVWRAGFVWDDTGYTSISSHLLGPRGLVEIWTSRAADIAPLTKTTFWIEHALWGATPLPYHLVNVALHAGCALLLWRVLRELQVPGAWLGAALWALHPVEVESVAWMSETKNTQSGLFFLLSILFFLRWRRGAGKWSGVLTFLCAALAMASKSSTVVLPLVLGLVGWWEERSWRWDILRKVGPIFLLSLAASALSIWTQALHILENPDPRWERSWPQRLAGAGDAVWFYLGKLLWPHPLMTIYPRWEIVASAWTSYVPLATVVLLLSMLGLCRDGWARPWFFAFAYFLIALFPVLGLVDNPIFRYSLVFDHMQYLAAMGPLALAGAGVARLAELVGGRKRWPGVVLVTGVLALLGVTSWLRAWVYETPEIFWTDALEKNPECWLGYYNLGDALVKRGAIDDAVANYRRAIEIYPNHAASHNNLGYALMRQGQTSAAMDEYLQALAIKPGYADAQGNLANGLVQMGHPADAMSHYQKALATDPGNAKIHFDYGNALGLNKQLPEAIAEYQKAIALNSGYVDAYTNLAIALARSGKMDEAIAPFREAARLNPTSRDAQENLERAEAALQARH